MIRPYRFFSILLLTLAAHSVSAQSDDTGSFNKYPGWIAGVAYAVAPNPFVGEADDASQVLPLVGYMGERLTWLGPYASYRLLGDKRISVSAVAQLRFDGFDSDSNDPQLAGLNKRQNALEGGFDLAYGPLSLAGRHDLSGTHKGSTAELAYSHDWRPTRLVGITAGVSAQWQSRDVINYYYGVTDSEASAARSSYSAGSAINYGVDIQLTFIVGKRSILFARADTRWLDNSITRSPIVKDNQQASAFVGFAYQLFPRQQ